MIAHLEGTLIHKAPDNVIVDIHGLGYRVFVSPDTLTKLPKGVDEKVSLWTHLAVRENALDLYGFLTRDELLFFELLIGVSGIGPKSALSVLSLATVETLRSSISSGDTTYLTKVSGIGRKMAEKIVLELRDKLGAANEGDMAVLKTDSDVVDALKTLGYHFEEIREVLKQIPDDTSGTSERVREALKALGGGTND